ncbi:metallophosphoesterase family protein [Synoicihabitans lomoniglobus]|uniref:Phosphoesterase n=1 Tax=Synoicihabitans lomoniglobus TaxID=2909285 RepID=A0AAF0CM97_9BACT|nr:metallophosphatase family protein [Opitutaceae bacterium LMO-M01]WED63813.1 metallophosphoesterase family protein [Opitutaceae bacterium LMO-M01]
MRIAVISDTHDHMPPMLPGRLADADEIWHLGDVCDPDTLVELELLDIPLWTVAGNCDSWPTWPLHRRMERAGHTFHLEHIPLDRAPRGVTAVLHGHTHVPRDETDMLGVRWLNPGSASSPRYDGPPSFAWLTLDESTDRGPYSWSVESLEK